MDDSGTGGQGREIVNLVSDDEGMPSVAWGNIHEMKAQIDQLRQESDMQLDKEMDDEAMSPTECFGEDSDIEDNGLRKIQKLVDAAKVVSQAGSGSTSSVTVESDEHGAIDSAVKKLKMAVPVSLVMPWERGFAGLVLGQSGSAWKDPMTTFDVMPKRPLEVEDVPRRRRNQ